MKRIVIVRQRPAMGDALLLSPMIREIKSQYPDSHITVITDPLYMAGALTTIFQGIRGVDRIEHIPQIEWTDLDNKDIDGALRIASDEVPCTVKKADLVLNCNAAFIHFEREHEGTPPHGIAEFWCRHHAFYQPGMDLLPEFTVNREAAGQVDTWLGENAKRPAVGIVLSAGDPVRDWNFNNIANSVVDWVHTSGYCPITIDPYRQMPSPYTLACIGRKLDFVAALLQRCEVVLTPDTGLLHLSQAVGTKTVSLWGIMEPRLRVDGYNTVVVPKECLGICEGGDLKYCQCLWKFQQWSCLRRLTLNQIIKGLEEALRDRQAERDTDRGIGLGNPQAPEADRAGQPG